MSRRVFKKKRKRRRRPNLVLPVIIGALVVIYLGMSGFFMTHFLPGTVIGDVNCGGKSPDRVKDIISAQASEYKLTIVGKDGQSEVISAQDINLQFLLDDTISQVKDSQNAFAWPAALASPKSHGIGIETSYDEARLESTLKAMSFFKNRMMDDLTVTTQDGEEIYKVDTSLSAAAQNPGSITQTQARTYTPTYFDLSESDMETPDVNRTKAAIREAIEGLEETLDLELAGCYGDKDIVQEPEEDLSPYGEKLKKYRSAQITYDWHGMTEVVDQTLIDQWLITDESAGTVDIDEEAVKEYVTSLSKKYDRFGSPRTFHTTKGDDIRISVVCYGWFVNRDKETMALIEDIREGNVVSREPDYKYTAYSKGEDDIGDSYVEIDLNSQHLWLYIDGKKEFESDFVSGNLSKRFDTPDGIYPITYKERDATLNGQGYSSPVKYWMPFNGNVGMHDASWRSDFGGDIFLRNGSHGCVNLPTSSAKTIYEKVDKGFPVIVYGGDKARARFPGSKEEPKPEPVENEAQPEVDPAVLLQMQQMLLLQQQQLQEIQQGGADPAASEVPAGIDNPESAESGE